MFSITSYLIRKCVSGIAEVTRSSIDDFLSLDLPVVIACISEGDESSHDVFTSIAEKHPDSLFGISSDYNIWENEDKRPFIVHHSPLDQALAMFQEKFEPHGIEEFLARSKNPLIGKFSLQSYHAYTQVCLTPSMLT